MAQASLMAGCQDAGLQPRRAFNEARGAAELIYVAAILARSSA
jgi:hypothetical protein